MSDPPGIDKLFVCFSETQASGSGEICSDNMSDERGEIGLYATGILSHDTADVQSRGTSIAIYPYDNVVEESRVGELF